ncbi:hypothetical protein GGTG_07213 [Gaeumannomyces tritici R3-111a-1]|uniref:Uncharacterized protein n=1 Tax=Gaeumannomyces tritici (strain R3-111a-1) TaxID=644352 RepID=J3P116_GAET3|nr:hypothetical protein GGTG_07213 [Gaeumannomyces tritici R3-111a-1]EJT77301.1 hypothetical protein GGTG_07213 [Gaeumannomyces tritici R3-111a-1]
MASTRRKQSQDMAADAGPEFPPPAYISIPLNSPDPGAYKTPTTNTNTNRHPAFPASHYGHLPALPPAPAQRPTSVGYGVLRLLLKAVAISASLLCSSLFLSLIPGPVPLHARQTAQVAAVWRGSDVNIKRGRGGPRASLLPPLKPSDINALTTCRSHRTRTLKDRALWCNG